MLITKKDVREALRAAGLKCKSVCIHSSLRSFGGLKDGPAGVLDAFLEDGCTVITPSFSFGSFMVRPPDGMMPARNGVDYGDLSWIPAGNTKIFSPSCNEMDREEMGALPAELLSRDGRIRGNHPLCSFAALGPFAGEIIRPQEPGDVMAPLRELTLFEGYILLAGVGLNRATILHLAGQMAGRNLFVRWAKGGANEVIRCEAGGCSEGFTNMEPYLCNLAKTVMCGKSRWMVFHAGKLLKTAARLIQLKPAVTRCKEPACIRCEDAIAGGPGQT
ncbi:MAG: AAC(3) family N-acetyltransferase [Spirochaetia bacterium]|nr:AAC(3) family N-acetyltransferase [Spirochaetia bacterium]